MLSYEGVEFWENGDPPRKYKIISVLDDNRPNALIPSLTQKKDVASKVKEANGDAVILIEDMDKITGFSGNVNYTGQVDVSANSRKVRKYYIIKYLD